VEEFNVHPNVFRNLRIGEAIVMTRDTGRCHLTKLDRVPRKELSHDYRDEFNKFVVERRDVEKVNSKREQKEDKVLSLSAEIF